MALGTSALVLALSVYGAWSEIRGYGPVSETGPGWADVPGPVLAFLAAWLALTLSVLLAWSLALGRSATWRAAGASRS
jgi:hypothetical protein